MIVDNREHIKNLIAGCGQDEFYMLQILHRVKDGHTKYEPQDKKSCEQIVKTYFVTGPDYIDKKMEEIIDLCKMFNARAMINLNKKSWKQVALKSLELTAQALGKEGKDEKWWKEVRSSVESACGQTGACDGNKRWILDVDTKDENELATVKGIINMCEPLDVEKVVDVIPTIHGYHIVTRPFNKQKFMLHYEAVCIVKNQPVEDIIKDNNPTILYAESIDE